jgi:hypothetical protein
VLSALPEVAALGYDWARESDTRLMTHAPGDPQAYALMQTRHANLQ